MRKNAEHPEWEGTTAVGPIATRLIWENNQVVEWHIFCDFKSREKQQTEQAKAKME